MLVLIVVSLVLVAAGAVPIQEEPPLQVSDALKLCRGLGVDIQVNGNRDEYLATKKESKNLRRCFDILTTAEQSAITEVAMLGVLMKKLQIRQELGEPIYDLMTKGLPVRGDKGAGAKAVTKGSLSGVGEAMLDKSGKKGQKEEMVMSRQKRQVGMGMQYGGVELGEDPGKQARKLRLGIPLGEAGEDPGKRMRQMQQARVQNPAYQRWLQKYYRWYQYYHNKRRMGQNRKPAAGR